ncbi:hypothetical protein ABZ439_19225 [Streptomyces sp. NPDC005840]|uniref:hypothetical protein n=1 Tax=Streptomyces sp. NPDC005840 TaxID=3157072 RepID=UPI00340FE3D1
MMFSSTPLASGADPGSVIVGLLSGLAGIVFATLTLRHHRQVWAWTRRLRASDDVGKDLDDALTYLRELAEHLSERAQKPCREAEFAPLPRLRHLLDDAADDAEPIRPELRTVVERFDRYLTAVLPPATIAARVTATEHATQLAAAMRQEQARIDLKGAVSTAQQRIRALRRAA